MAQKSVDNRKSKEIHSSTTSLDKTKSKTRRKNTSSFESGQGMAAVRGQVGSVLSGLHDKRRNDAKGNRILEKSARPTAIYRNFKNWKGGWRQEILTEGERLWIERMRLGEDQHVAAKRIGCTRWEYQLKEHSFVNSQVMKIADFEWCRIMRRRAGKSQREVAEDLQIERVRVVRLENGFESCDNLLWYWEQ